MRPPVIKCLAGLLLLWGLASLGMRWFRDARPTAEQVAAALADRPEDPRAGSADDFIRSVNRLPHDERQKLFHDSRVAVYFNRLEPDTQLRVFEETLPRGLSEAIQIFNRMEEDERRTLIDRARGDLERFERSVQAAARGRNPERREQVQALADRLSREGLRAYLREADAQAKLELQPLLEQMNLILRKVNW